MVLASGPDGDLHILSQGGEEVHQALDGEGSRLATHEAGNVRLLDTKDLTGFGLGKAALLD